MLMPSPGGTAAGPGASPERREPDAGGAPGGPPCLEEQAVLAARWASFSRAFTRYSWMVMVCSWRGTGGLLPDLMKALVQLLGGCRRDPGGDEGWDRRSSVT